MTKFSNGIRILPNPGVPVDPPTDEVGDDLEEESIELVELIFNPPMDGSLDFDENDVMLWSDWQLNAPSKIELALFVISLFFWLRGLACDP